VEKAIKLTVNSLNKIFTRGIFVILNVKQRASVASHPTSCLHFSKQYATPAYCSKRRTWRTSLYQICMHDNAADIKIPNRGSPITGNCCGPHLSAYESVISVFCIH